MTTIAVDVDNVTLAQLLAYVERGESLALTRDGQRFATLLPDAGPPTDEERRKAYEAFQALFAIRQRLRDAGHAMSFQEYKEARDEGRP